MEAGNVTLSTERLVLVPLTSAKLWNVNWMNDPEVVKYSEQRHKSHTLKSCQHYIDSCGFAWTIRLLSINMAIGNVTAHLDLPNATGNLGILIGDRTQWGEGYGLEAWSAAADWLLNKGGGGLRKLEGGCMAVNTPMIRIFERSRFEFEGERRSHFVWNGSQTCGERLYGRFA